MVKRISNKIRADVPAVKKIQETMNNVIDYFRRFGYVPKKGSLERTPSADEFVTRSGVKNALVDDVTEHIYSVANVPIQKYSSYKPWEGAGVAYLKREDFENGKCVRRVFKEDGDYPERCAIKEFEYKDDVLSEVVEYSSGGFNVSGSRKIIDVDTGDYCIEILPSYGKGTTKTYYNKANQMLKKVEDDQGVFVRQVSTEYYNPNTQNVILKEKDYMYANLTGKDNKKIYYNDDNQIVKEIEIRVDDFLEETSTSLYDPVSQKIMAMEVDKNYGGFHGIHKCEIDPKTDIIIKYSLQDYDTGEMVFLSEFDKSGNLIYHKNTIGMEYKYDSVNGEFIETDAAGRSVTSESDRVKDIWEQEVFYHLPSEMMKRIKIVDIDEWLKTMD